MDIKKQEQEKQEIGIIVYSYKRNKSDNYCIYTYDPIYVEFINKICFTYEGNEEERLIGHRIIPKSELSVVKWLLNEITEYSVDISDLHRFFELIDSNEDAYCFDYDSLLNTYDEQYSIIGLNEKKLDNFRR